MKKEELQRITGHDGKGADRCGTKADGLRFDWKFSRVCELSMLPANDKRRLPCQSCSVTVYTGQGYFTFSVVAWSLHNREGYTYEAQLKLNGESLATKEKFLTRLAAQIEAEKLLQKYIIELQQSVKTMRRLSL